MCAANMRDVFLLALFKHQRVSNQNTTTHRSMSTASVNNLLSLIEIHWRHKSDKREETSRDRFHFIHLFTRERQWDSFSCSIPTGEYLMNRSIMVYPILSLSLSARLTRLIRHVVCRFASSSSVEQMKWTNVGLLTRTWRRRQLPVVRSVVFLIVNKCWSMHSTVTFKSALAVFCFSLVWRSIVSVYFTFAFLEVSVTRPFNCISRLSPFSIRFVCWNFSSSFSSTKDIWKSHWSYAEQSSSPLCSLAR